MRIKSSSKLFDVYLRDDGTMDTVITIQPVSPRKRPRGQEAEYWPEQEVRFDGEYASFHRRSNGEMTAKGLRELGREACADYDFEEVQS